jgi:hypothetical protein
MRRRLAETRLRALDSILLTDSRPRRNPEKLRLLPKEVAKKSTSRRFDHAVITVIARFSSEENEERRKWINNSS